VIKHTSFVKFKSTLAPGEGDRWWRDEFGPLVVALPGIQRYVQNPVVSASDKAGALDGPPAFDGLGEMWWHDMESFDAALDSPQWSACLVAAAEVVDPDWARLNLSAEIEERICRVGMGAKHDGVGTPPGDAVKLIGLLRYRDDMTRDECNNYWRTVHRRFALRIPQMGHYVQNHVMRGTQGAFRAGFDGYSEAFFVDRAGYEDAMDSEPWRTLEADGPELFDMSVFVGGIVQERVLKEYRPG
jgi:uncharacterized protein (TIGR02118 family)